MSNYENNKQTWQEELREAPSAAKDCCGSTSIRPTTPRCWNNECLLTAVSKDAKLVLAEKFKEDEVATFEEDEILSDATSWGHIWCLMIERYYNS